MRDNRSQMVETSTNQSELEQFADKLKKLKDAIQNLRSRVTETKLMLYCADIPEVNFDRVELLFKRLNNWMKYQNLSSRRKELLLNRFEEKLIALLEDLEQQVSRFETQAYEKTLVKLQTMGFESVEEYLHMYQVMKQGQDFEALITKVKKRHQTLKKSQTWLLNFESSMTNLNKTGTQSLQTNVSLIQEQIIGWNDSELSSSSDSVTTQVAQLCSLLKAQLPDFVTPEQLPWLNLLLDLAPRYINTYQNTSDKPILSTILGAPASGKSTLIDVLDKKFLFWSRTLVDPDVYKNDIWENITKYNLASDPEFEKVFDPANQWHIEAVHELSALLARLVFALAILFKRNIVITGTLGSTLTAKSDSEPPSNSKIDKYTQYYQIASSSYRVEKPKSIICNLHETLRRLVASRARGVNITQVVEAIQNNDKYHVLLQKWKAITADQETHRDAQVEQGLLYSPPPLHQKGVTDIYNQPLVNIS